MYDEFKLDFESDSIRLVSHNSVLNCLFILTTDSKLYLYDCNTRTKLKEINLQNKIDLNYNYFKILNIQDKCIIVSDRTICSRLANEGLFLLDTVLQPSVLNLAQTNSPELVFRTLEINLNDAVNLVQCLKQIESDSIQGLDSLIKQIEYQCDSLSKLEDTSWLTVQITENYFTLLTLLTQCLDEIKRINIQSVSIPIISLLLDRLYRLDANLIEKQIHGGALNAGLPGVPQNYGNFDKRYMCSEATRRATFSEWPHMDYKWVLPDALAQAGFYHQPTHPGDDRTICFVCDLCLVAWEQHDQPWSEHERHSPICQFVRGELTENVPLSLTAATQAANLVYKSNDPKDTVVCTSELSSERYFAVSNSSGHIIVYDSKDILKEMMHVQLINESQYNKDFKLKIHSLCFYYRNHKHVLYGSFTINDEVFIFSFNIFDIFRSYHSKSNKKSSKTHKTTSNSAPTKSSSSTQKASSSQTASKTLQTTPVLPPPVQEAKTMESIIGNELKNNDLSQLVTQDITLFSEGTEFQKYMNNIIKIDSDLPAPKIPIEVPEVTLQHQLSSENSTKNNSDDASDQKELKKNASIEKEEQTVKSKAESNSAQLNTFLNNNKNAYYDNMFSLILNSEGQKLNQNSNSFDLFTLPKTQPIIPKQLGSFQAALSQSSAKTSQALNLSNFLNVRFEITPNNQQPPTVEQTSKSKNKYKKTIKILTVSCRPLNALYSNEQVPDIQLKSYEFTEKCLSFRLASIDLSAEQRTSFDIKLINLYEKYLCALVNFRNVQSGIESFKLFRIKHEETSSSSSASIANNNSSSSINSVDSVKPKLTETETGAFSSSCLAATSSSRLNLTEFILTSITSTGLNSKVVSIMPISVTTLEDDDSDLKYVCILNDQGVISIIDPNKCCKVIEFSSPSIEDKFAQMIYCYGIDKICGVTENGKIHMISTRVHPIVNQSLLDEISDCLNLNEISLTKKLLVDAPLDSFNLSILHNLSTFDTGKTNFSAKLPACWSLVLSEQHQQRKHPQHILAESSNYTKCWKYLNSTITTNTPNFTSNYTNENLNIEIYLNKPIQIGCIQIKLKFSKELTSPFELSVLRQKRIDQSNKSSIDAVIDFSLNNKQELIFGPIDVREFLDTSNAKTYLITICSPKLYETRSNLFYLNLKSNCQNCFELDSPNQKDPKLSPSQLQKIQLTIRKYRRNGLQYETIERSLMLTRPNFFASILSHLFQTNSPDSQIKIIDILNWLFYNYFGNVNSEYLREVFSIFEENLNKFLLISYVFGTRSKSRKATLLLSFLLSQTFDPDKQFARKLLKSLLNLLNYLSNFESSSSMNWFFVILHQCMSLDVESTHEKCLELLNNLSQIQKYNPYYALLKMRFNFTGLIFEPKLFDLDSCLKFDTQKLTQNQPQAQTSNQPINQTTTTTTTTSNPFTFSFGTVGLSVQHNQQTQPANNVSHNIFNLKETPSILNETSGLIEVLPLSYKSLSSSNGSSIEKNGLKQDNSLYILPDYFSLITNPDVSMLNNDPGLDTNILSSIFTLNPVQYMVIDRMEPMSKHFVILDFGYPVCLTDIKIPSCAELSSLSVDIWLNKEQKDSKRLCLSTDINVQSISLSDLQPPPVCRYLKLIFVAHSSNIVKAKIPLGYYFGHPYIFTNEQAPNIDAGLPQKNPKQTMAYLSYLEKLYEDSKCHYSISINKLKDLLNEIQFPTDNIGHLKMMQFSDTQNSEQTQKIKDQYNECLDYQFKLNLNSQLIKKLRLNLYSDNQSFTLNLNDSVITSEDHLRVANSMLIKTLICLSSEKLNAKFSIDQALNLFSSLCVNGNLDKECSWLLIRLCQNEPWWGEFISSCLKIYFVKQIKQPVYLSKIFVTLNEMCLKSLNGRQGQIMFNSLFSLVEEILLPLNENRPVEVTCLEWILLFISRLLSVTNKSKETSRWEFLENIYSNNKNSKNTPAIRQKTKIKKKLFQSNKYLTWNKLKETRKNLEKYRKHLWKAELGQMSNTSNSNELNKNLKKIALSRDLSLRVCRLIGKLLVESNSYCSSDLFVLSCRIISSLCCCCSQPSITLSEIFDNNDLNQLILLNVSGEFNHGSVCWGSPWSQHALLSLCMDVIENEKAPCEIVQRDNRPGQNLEKSLRMIEEIDELNIDKKLNPTSVVDAVKISSNLAKNFSQIADILTSHLSNEDDIKTPDKEFPHEQSIINNLVESAMNKKLEEIKNNMVAPLQQMNSLFTTQTSFVNKKFPSTQLKNQCSSWQKFTTDIHKFCTDNRLDSSFYKTIEYQLNLKITSQNENFQNSLNESLNLTDAVNEVDFVEPKVEPKSSVKFLQDTLEGLFEDLSVINIENLLHFWLTLSTPNTAGADQNEVVKETPILTLKHATCLNLLEYLNQFNYMTVKTWHLSFRIMSVLLDTDSKISQFFVQNDALYKFIYKFLGSNETMVGDECCQSMVEFLKKIEKSINFEQEKLFKIKLFELLNLSLDQDTGCIARSLGPIDAQVTFLEYLIAVDYLKVYDLDSLEFENYFIKYFNLLSKLTQYHICTYPRVSIKGLTSPRSCFAGVLTSILFGTKDNKFNKITDMPTSQFSPSTTKKYSDKKPSLTVQCTRDLLICLLLKFSINFLNDLKPSNQLSQNLNDNEEPDLIDSSTNETTDEINNFYEDDDLLLQQLFLYELQINDPETVQDSNDLNEPELETSSKPLVIKRANSNLPEVNLKRKKLIRLITPECLEVLIETLALCQSSALAMVISNSGYPIDLNLDDIQTPGDGVFLLLKSISVNSPLKLVDPSFNYLKKMKRLSEPLLWLFSTLFQNEQVVKSFIDKNGLDIISKGLQNTTRQLLYSGPCIVSSLMNLIDSERQTIKNSDSESTEGFTNFAPYGSILCTNPTGNPVDVLVQNSAPHRRIRSSIWSYHFQSDENKVGLYLSFPYAFLLKEVHILPHTVSFGNCPAYVSIEVSRDGSFMTPIGPPVYTMGMSCIKLQLNKSELVNTVQINLYKSKDSQMIGLSQIKLLGYPMFENMLSAKPDMMLTPVEDLVSRSNMGWLRLLYMCLTSVPQLESLVCEKINDSTMLLCTRLLSSPAMIIYDKITETILLKLSKYDKLRSLEISKCLLRSENGANTGLYSVPHGVLMETLVNILYQISDNLSQDLEVKHTNIILDWLEETIVSYDRHPTCMIFHCVACILYKSKELKVSEKFLKNFIQYSQKLNEFYTRQSVNWILCSLFHKNPEYLRIFMEYLHDNPNDYLIDTLSYIIQSDRVLELFLTCEYFENFVNDFQQNLKNFSISLGRIKILLSMAEYERGQEWLGSENGQKLWQGLIKLMSNSYTTIKDSEQLGALCIKLVKKLIFMNENNQIIFSNFVTQMIKEASSVEFYLEKNPNSNSFPTISGFLHQLILQVLLDDQTITVNFNRKTPFKSSCNSSLGILFHPKYSTGTSYKAIELQLSKTCSSMTNILTDLPISILNSKTTTTTQTHEFTSSSTENFFEMKDFLTKLKNDSKKEQLKLEQQLQQQPVNKLRLYLTINDVNYYISNDFTLEKILSFYIEKTGVRSLSHLNIGVCVNGEESGEYLDDVSIQFSSPLETFVKCNGLTVLAERLPVLMPFIHEPLLSITDKDRASGQQEQPKTSPDFVDYVIMNESDGPFVDEMYNEMPVTTTNTLNAQSNKLKKMTMPPHAFIAFGLFLKIPGYATVMMRNKKQAQCILKLLLGANRNKDEEFGLSLSTMPFSSLKDLLTDTKTKDEEKKILTNFVFENRILTFLLSILSNISHHPHRQKTPHFCQSLVADNSTPVATTEGTAALTSEEKSNLYWAKGTGFGTGSTIQQWDAEKTLMQQKMDEEHVACILEILSSYIECCEDISDSILELIDHSCVINALSSYLRNDSVLDISRHIPLYKSALKLLQSLIISERLRALIEQCSIFELIKNMKQFVDSYTQRIRLTEEEGDFASLVPVLNNTYDLVISYVKPVENTIQCVNDINLDDHDIDRIYCDYLKPLQFDTFSIVSETSNGIFKSNLSFYYESSLNDLSVNLNNANRAKRLAQETVTLSNSLPLSFSSSVFVRCDEERLDVMKVMITGPQDTPYANGCFEFDVFFPADYPDSPPMINLQTTGNQTVRFNPNLYHDGKVCLSILNTWHGRPEERWNGQTSSFLQVLVSIQSLILVSEPYFNEPGYERSRGTPAGTIASVEHDANIRQATVRWAMLEMIRKPPACFKDAIQKHFYFKKKEIKEQCEQWLRELESHVNDKQIGASMAKNAVALKRHMSQLFELLDQLKLEEIEDVEGSNTTLEENQEHDETKNEEK